MPFTPATLRSYVDTNIEDNASQQVTPADVRNSFKVAADVMGAVYPDGAASDFADDAAASALAADASADAAAASAIASAASAAASAASAASVDGSTLLTKSGNLTGLTDVPVAVGNLGLTDRILQVGDVILVIGVQTRPGAMKLNGATYFRADFPALVAYATLSGRVAASEGAKGDGQFGPGNGTTTFSVPDARGYFPRFWDDAHGIDPGRTIGSVQAHAIQNHTHSGTSGTVGAHGHAVTDPGHAHEYYTRASSGTGNQAIENSLAGSGTGTLTTYFSSTDTTNISIQSAGGHTVSITTGNPSVGGAAETRPINFNLVPWMVY